MGRLLPLRLWQRYLRQRHCSLRMRGVGQTKAMQRQQQSWRLHQQPTMQHLAMKAMLAAALQAARRECPPRRLPCVPVVAVQRERRCLPSPLRLQRQLQEMA